jgi:GDPmannose 4,6-dehydratase
VTRTISHGVARIELGLDRHLLLGNLDARRDWGFAGDYVRSMHLMLQQPEPDDYGVATGLTHAVREWCEIAFAHVGLDYRAYVTSDEHFWRPREVVPLVGDTTKAKNELGWSAATSFDDLVITIVDAEIDRSGQNEAYDVKPGDAS